MRNYRDNWFNVGAVLAMAIAGALAISYRRLSSSRLFSVLNLAALMVHQFEEYGFPGYFPGLLNAGVFKSDKPDRYPLNTNSALIVNAAAGYPFYLLPVLFPKRRSLGLPPCSSGSVKRCSTASSPPPREGPLRSRIPDRLLLARAHRHQLPPRGRLRGAVGVRGVGSCGGLHARLRRARDRCAAAAAEGGGEPLPLHGAASGTVWLRRLMPPLFTEPPRETV